MQQHLDALCDLARRHGADGMVDTAIPGVAIMLSREPTPPMMGVYTPRFCLVLQGAKELLIGDKRLRYDPLNYFIASLDLPFAGCVMEATSSRPYLGVSMALEVDMIAALITDMSRVGESEGAGFAVSPVTPALLDPWVRMMALLDAPADIAMLAPMLQREILYRLLQGPEGGVLRQIAQSDTRLGQVRRAIAWIREHFDQPLRVEKLADMAGMSTASFHRHFKAATAMSPLQYQKSIRLQEARRMLVTKQDAARVAYAVGYESASQFSREYARHFGAPPGRDAVRLRNGDVQVEAGA